MKMPVIFIGHGSPMNAIEKNTYSESWKELGKSIPKPKTILAISAHWMSRGETLVSKSIKPNMVYDMYGFPPELYRVEYPAPGSPEIAEEVSKLIPNSKLVDRGMDHGIWSVLVHMYPDATIPVIPMSINISARPEDLIQLGKKLKPLREEGILIFGNGNIVHNLTMLDWTNTEKYPWAIEFDNRVASLIDERNIEALSRYKSWGDIARLAHPSDEHFLPIFPLIGATDIHENVTYFTPNIEFGSLSMRSILWKE